MTYQKTGPETTGSTQDFYSTLNAEERTFYHRAYEAAMYFAPAIAVKSQVNAGTRDLGAGPYDIIYTGEPMDARWGGITYNNQSPYWVAGFSVKDEPVVVEIPPASDKVRFFGSIHDVWWLPLEDFGPAGVDEGKGGKYLVLPPDYDGPIPNGFITIRSGSYTHFIPGRSILSKEGTWDDAIDYIKQLKIYPLSQSGNPAKMNFLQGAGKTYNAQPTYDIDDFIVLNSIIQEEPARSHDLAMHGMLSESGIKKGEDFTPGAREVEIMNQAAKDLQMYCMSKVQDGSAFGTFWEGSTWSPFRITPEIAAGGASFVFPDAVDYRARMTDWFYFSGGMYKRYDGTKPSSTFYLWTGKDKDGNALDPTKTYRIRVPANPPMRDFWSIIAYGLESRTFADYPVFTVASSDKGVALNDDGSFDLYISPEPVEGFEKNTIVTNGKDDYFLCYRLYGAEPSLWEKKWILGDPELVK